MTEIILDGYKKKSISVLSIGKSNLDIYMDNIRYHRYQSIEKIIQVKEEVSNLKKQIEVKITTILQDILKLKQRGGQLTDEIQEAESSIISGVEKFNKLYESVNRELDNEYKRLKPLTYEETREVASKLDYPDEEGASMSTAEPSELKLVKRVIEIFLKRDSHRERSQLPKSSNVPFSNEEKKSMLKSLIITSAEMFPEFCVKRIPEGQRFVRTIVKKNYAYDSGH